MRSSSCWAESRQGWEVTIEILTRLDKVRVIRLQQALWLACVLS